VATPPSSARAPTTAPARGAPRWGAKITDGRLVGQNFMGRMLRRFMLSHKKIKKKKKLKKLKN
jgi:hypothetical protein